MVVKVKDVVKRFGDLVALDNISLDIKKGEIYGILGPNGSGKTTLLNCMLALLKYDKGMVSLFDQEMSPVRYDLKSKIGYVPQEIVIIEELNVYENIDFFCGLYIQDRDIRKKCVEDAINFVGLDSFRKFKPKKLSGGLKRRLNLACGISHKPELLILDEPTVAVDPQSRNSILEGIKKLNENGTTVIYTTHYIEEVEQICTKISIMDRGKVLVTGDKYELKESVGLTDKLILKEVRLNEVEIENISKLKGVGKVSKNGDDLYVKLLDNLSVSHIFTYLENNDIFFKGMEILSPTLNDVFLEITGKELRDE